VSGAEESRTQDIRSGSCRRLYQGSNKSLIHRLDVILGLVISATFAFSNANQMRQSAIGTYPDWSRPPFLFCSCFAPVQALGKQELFLSSSFQKIILMSLFIGNSISVLPVNYNQNSPPGEVQGRSRGGSQMYAAKIYSQVANTVHPTPSSVARVAV
jgi:hypothetical protein